MRKRIERDITRCQRTCQQNSTGNQRGQARFILTDFFLVLSLEARKWPENKRAFPFFSLFGFFCPRSQAPSMGMNGTADTAKWTEEKNARRVALIERKHAAGLAPLEHVELAGLQLEMLCFHREVAPLPLEDARRLQQELPAQAAQNASK
jgi:hypothetical protein